MTPQQAKAIYFLTGQAEYAQVLDYQQSLLRRLHGQLETCSERDLRFLQGQIEEIKHSMAIRETAHTILETENAKTI